MDVFDVRACAVSPLVSSFGLTNTWPLAQASVMLCDGPPERSSSLMKAEVGSHRTQPEWTPFESSVFQCCRPIGCTVPGSAHPRSRHQSTGKFGSQGHGRWQTWEAREAVQGCVASHILEAHRAQVRMQRSGITALLRGVVRWTAGDAPCPTPGQQPGH